MCDEIIFTYVCGDARVFKVV